MREKINLLLKIEGCSEEERKYIVDNLARLAVEKTLEDVLDEVSPEELEEMQKYIKKDPNDLPEILEKNSKNDER